MMRAVTRRDSSRQIDLFLWLGDRSPAAASRGAG
jgi:hypothetical protein